MSEDLRKLKVAQQCLLAVGVITAKKYRKNLFFSSFIYNLFCLLLVFVSGIVIKKA